jgi:hypothetical protein
MAILTNNLSAVISGVIAGINDGVEDVGGVAPDVQAKPPETITFEIDSIFSLNSLKREELIQQGVATSVTTAPAVNATDDFYIGGALVHSQTYEDESAFSSTTTITTAGISKNTSFEDNAIGFILNIKGPETSARENRA